MEMREKILKLVSDNVQMTAKDLADSLSISKQALHRHLAVLIFEKRLVKSGKPPKVFYMLGAGEIAEIEYEIGADIKRVIDQNYFIITPGGEKLDGLTGFIYWCKKQKLPIEKTAFEYVETLKKYASFKDGDVINGMFKMQTTFDNVFLDAVYYLDFYSIERFGKTKLGQLLLYAKQSQDKKLIADLIFDIKSKIEKIIERFKIDGVGFVPPTIKREVQFMSELNKKLSLPVREVRITKIKTDVIIPQKTLNKLNDRVENARMTFAIEETASYENILLIDDAVGSGATLNELAKKIKNKGIAKKVFGLAITGSFKGIDVINEV